MRGLIVASLAAAGLAAAFTTGHGDDQVRRRKTLGFGPVLPHATYNTAPVVPTSFVDSTEPFEVARAFVNDITRGVLPANSFVIRKDSYTDKTTGVSHVYVRQLLNGIEVADGDINLNIKDGVVLSYGDSFHREQTAHILGHRRLADPHAEHCSSLGYELEARIAAFNQQLASQGEQVVLGAADLKEALAPLPELLEWNCEHVETPYLMSANPSLNGPEVADPATALLQFMIAATPSKALAESMINDPLSHIFRMGSSWETHFVGGHGAATATITNVPGTVNPVKAKLAFAQVPVDGISTLELVWKFEVEMEDNWYEAAVTADAPHRIVSVVDWASDSPMPVAPVPKEPAEHKAASYNVFAWGVNDPSVGNRSMAEETIDTLASPAGWHSLPFYVDPASAHLNMKPEDKQKFRNTTTTWGNNVFAHENWEGRNAWVNNYRPDAGVDMVFNFTYNPKETERADSLDEAKKYINATITQLFFTSNLVHDLFYRYGFDEVSGNFQQHNFGRGGEENDAVIHELAHGLSTRLTGGPANSGCLGWGESGGMGEGWGDFLATTIRSTKNYSDYAMGSWAANRPNGIRNYPYSLNDTVNPSTYSTLDKPGYWGVHAIGEVWAQILWVVSQKLITKHGFVDSLFPPLALENGTVPEGDFYRPAEFTSTGERKPLVPKHGNSLAVQLVLNGMKMQPCRPSFLDARDAIIEADQVLTGGENFCDLWEGFAARGLGPNARVDGQTPWGGGIRTNDFEIPLKCASKAA